MSAILLVWQRYITHGGNQMTSFSDFLMEGKYQTGKSMRCGHCGDHVLPATVSPNSKHIYPVGMFFECIGCHKCRMWTNSIRNVDNFLAFLTGQTDRYFNGFCNDQFCGYCYGYVQPLENGHAWGGKRWDRYGCEKCVQNQQILVDGNLKLPEGDTSYLMNWYRAKIDRVKAVWDSL